MIKPKYKINWVLLRKAQKLAKTNWEEATKLLKEAYTLNN